MLTLKRTGKWLSAFVALSLVGVPLLAAPPSGGSGGNKVTVTAANPPDAFQGEELDVIVSGSGFDAGSQVTYLVTGTTDASQVEVLSVQYVSSTELKTRIRPKDNALPSEYDIEVRVSSGRKGKGTTLFRVKIADTACTGDEPKDPEIVYLSATEFDAKVGTQDIYLSSNTGCDQVLLLENAVHLVLPSDPKLGTTEYLSKAYMPRLDIEGELGVVAWQDWSLSPAPVLGWEFLVDAQGQIFIDPAGPTVLYQSQTGANVRGMDVRMSDTGEVELVLAEKLNDEDHYQLSFYNVQSNEYSVLTADRCHARDEDSQCYQQYAGNLYWSDSGGTVFFEPTRHPSLDGQALASIQRIDGKWQESEVLMTSDLGLQIVGISGYGILAYEFMELELDRKGRVTRRTWKAALIDPLQCRTFECGVLDGIPLSIDADVDRARGWTRSGGLLFVAQGAGADLDMREYSDPISGAVGRLFIPKVDPWQRDTTF